MNAIRRKLTSRQGSSFLFALIVFLICAMAGAAAITAASSNAGRFSHMQEDQQKYFTLSSAARLVRDELGTKTDDSGNSVPGAVRFEASAILIRKEIWRREDKDSDGNAIIPARWVGPEISYDFTEAGIIGKTPVSYTGDLHAWLNKETALYQESDLVKRFYSRDIPVEWHTVELPEEQQMPDGYSGTFTYGSIDQPLTVSVDGLETVCWMLEMDPNYNLTATFWLEGGAYKTVLELPANVDTRVDSYIGGGISGGSYIRMIETTTKVYTTVTWLLEDAIFTRVKGI